MLRFVADENFNGHILRGLLRRIPELDIVRAQDVDQLRGADDPTLLEWAAREQRVLLTHDVSTMVRHALERLRSGKQLAGVFEVHADFPIGSAIEELALVAQASFEGEWQGQVRFLPI